MFQSGFSGVRRLSFLLACGLMAAASLPAYAQTATFCSERTVL